MKRRTTWCVLVARGVAYSALAALAILLLLLALAVVPFVGLVPPPRLLLVPRAARLRVPSARLLRSLSSTTTMTMSRALSVLGLAGCLRLLAVVLSGVLQGDSGIADCAWVAMSTKPWGAGGRGPPRQGR
jgi:hypothetical protein